MGRLTLARFSQNFSICCRIVAAAALILLPKSVFAYNESSQSFTLDGQLFEGGSTTPLKDSNVQIKIQIINPAGTCVLYEEQQLIDTMSSNGFFTVNVGSPVGSAKRTVNDPGRTMAQIFQNIAPITANSAQGQTCTGNSYSPAAGAIRYFRITVTPSATGVADILSPDIVIDAVPQAIVAQSLQGLERANVLQVNSSAPAALTQSNLEAAFSGTAYSNLQAILAGNFMRQDSSGATLPSYASTPSGVSTGDIWYDSTSNQVKYQSNSGVQTIGTSTAGIGSLTVGSDLSVNGVTAGTVSNGSVTLGIATISSPGKVSGDAITAGTISGSAGINTSGNLITTGSVSGLTVQASNIRIYNGSKYLQMAASAMSSDVTLTWPSTAGSSGQVLSTDGTGNLSWISVSGTGAILNGGNSFAGDISIGTNDNQAFSIKTNNATALTVSQGGNVGIGTASPANLLSVNGNTSLNGSVVIGGSGAPTVGFEVHRDTFFFTNGNGTVPYFYTNGNGNIGVGTSSASASKLSVSGNMAVGSTYANSNAAPTNGLLVEGSVGIGTTSPRTALDVSGAIVTKPATPVSAATVDVSSGNIHYTTNSCGSFAFHNMKDGGTYMFVVKGTSVATCTFTAFSGAGTGALTVHMPADNGNTTSGKHTIYNLTVVGSDVYVAWTPGY